MNEITIIICSYNTPKLVDHCINSLEKFLPIKKHYLIYENSTNEETVELLKSRNLSFFRNPNQTHSISIEDSLKHIKTKYALIIDSDAIVISDLSKFLNTISKNDIDGTGIIQGSRGGYNLYERLAPWFLIFNADKIKEHNIRFHDEERISSTRSYGFYKNVPIQEYNGNKLYDVGSTFYEDMILNNFRIWDISGIEKFLFFHCEGSSWRRNASPQWNQIQDNIENDYMRICQKLGI